MTRLRAYPGAPASARTPHPHIFLRNSSRSDRPETDHLRPRRPDEGFGDCYAYQALMRQFRPVRPERPEMRGNTRGEYLPGSGGRRGVHALLGTSGRSGRSGRDPPYYPYYSGGYGYAVFPYFRPQLIHSGRSGRSLNPIKSTYRQNKRADHNIRGKQMRDAAEHLGMGQKARALPLHHTAATSAAVRAGRRQAIGIWPLLCWAFQRECAQLDFDEIGSEVGRSNVGIEYVLMQRAILGCSPDGGGRSAPHHDADIVAAALTMLPVARGGRRMAVAIAELARVGQVPDWVANPRPRCQPVGWKRSKHGTFAEREFWTEAGRWPSNRLGRDHGYACRVTYTDTARQVADLRRHYLQWWGALLELRDTLRIYGELTAFEVTMAMPPMAPWQKRS